MTVVMLGSCLLVFSGRLAYNATSLPIKHRLKSGRKAQYEDPKATKAFHTARSTLRGAHCSGTSHSSRGPHRVFRDTRNECLLFFLFQQHHASQNLTGILYNSPSNSGLYTRPVHPICVFPTWRSLAPWWHPFEQQNGKHTTTQQVSIAKVRFPFERTDPNLLLANLDYHFPPLPSATVTEMQRRDEHRPLTTAIEARSDKTKCLSRHIIHMSNLAPEFAHGETVRIHKRLGCGVALHHARVTINFGARSDKSTRHEIQKIEVYFMGRIYTTEVVVTV